MIMDRDVEALVDKLAEDLEEARNEPEVLLTVDYDPQNNESDHAAAEWEDNYWGHKA
jgi:hypothetical protein